MTTPYSPPGSQAFEIETPDGARLYGEHFGSGPTVVLCHCWLGRRTQWRAVAAELAADHHVVVYDHRGHGESTVGRMRPTIARLADDLAAVIDFLDLDRPLVAGHSLGGMVAIEAATRTGSAPGAIVLVSTSARAVGPNKVHQTVARFIARFVGSPLGDRIMMSRLGALIARLSIGRQAPCDATARTQSAVVNTPPAVRRTQYEAIIDFDAVDRLVTIDIPATVMVGRNDTLLPVRHAKRLHRHIAASRFDLLARAGHMLPLERPFEVAEAIAATSRRIDRRSKAGAASTPTVTAVDFGDEPIPLRPAR